MFREALTAIGNILGSGQYRAWTGAQHAISLTTLDSDGSTRSLSLPVLTRPKDDSNTPHPHINHIAVT